MATRVDTVTFSCLAARLVLACILIGSFYGCAGMEIPTPGKVISTSLTAGNLTVGMTKQQVESIWGSPDETKSVEDPAKWKGRREVWIYRGRDGAIPVGTGYFSKGKKLYFDGDNLTTIEE